MVLGWFFVGVGGVRGLASVVVAVWRGSAREQAQTEGSAAPHLLLKAQVDHAVRLVQAKVPAAVERHALAVQEVFQPAGRGDHQVHPLFTDQVAHGAAVQAADAKHRPQLGKAPLLQVRAVVLHDLEALCRELTGGADDEGDGSLPRRQGHAHLLLQRDEQRGEREDERLACVFWGCFLCWLFWRCYCGGEG